MMRLQGAARPGCDVVEAVEFALGADPRQLLLISPCEADLAAPSPVRRADLSSTPPREPLVQDSTTSPPGKVATFRLCAAHQQEFAFVEVDQPDP